MTGPTSQIPGLCQTATESAPAERISGRRVGIFETDSDYVKLAKQGGHKGKIRQLLSVHIDALKCIYMKIASVKKRILCSNFIKSFRVFLAQSRRLKRSL